MPQSYYKKPTFAIPRTIFRGAANNRKGYPQGKVMERAWKMSSYALPRRVIAPFSANSNGYARDTQPLRYLLVYKSVNIL